MKILRKAFKVFLFETGDYFLINNNLGLSCSGSVRNTGWGGGVGGSPISWVMHEMKKVNVDVGEI